MVVNVIVMILLMLITVYPVLYVIFASFSNSNEFMAHSGLLVHPLSPNFESYIAVFKNKLIFSGYINAIFIVLVGLIINMILTVFAAYGLSRKNLYFGKPIMFFNNCHNVFFGRNNAILSYGKELWAI